ncbi:unnamed protein product [Paramecium sonneborni]|uniref:Uncharacterized protein n=1 Tax=Paramecium sonneborni TaxID=65129 RepID=A0A8S1N6G3_9CILI|nr:unnamed protein product [Paramecium sonneborni]
MKDEFNHIFSTTRTQNPRMLDNQGQMIVDSINLNFLYMNHCVKKKQGNQQLIINKIDSLSKQKLDYQIRNIELFELLMILIQKNNHSYQYWIQTQSVTIQSKLKRMKRKQYKYKILDQERKINTQRKQISRKF